MYVQSAITGIPRKIIMVRIVSRYDQQTGRIANPFVFKQHFLQIVLQEVGSHENGMQEHCTA